MKVADYIFRFTTFQRRDNGLCRVRVFVLSNGTVFVLVTDIGQLGTGALVSYNIEWIRQQLSNRGFVPPECQFIEHNEPYDPNCIFGRGGAFHLVYFDANNRPSWKEIDIERTAELLECNELELSKPTASEPRLVEDAIRLKNQIDPFSEFPWPGSPDVTKRKLEIIAGQISKALMSALVDNSSNDQALQRILKQDLSLIAEVYASPEDEYICFSEFPVGDGQVDFALFTGRSWMDVVLIEVKGADYYILNRNSYGNFASKFNEAIKQIQGRLATIYDDGLKKFERQVHTIRARAEAGERVHNAFLGPRSRLEVDPEEGVKVRFVVIGGRTRDDLEESKQRHNFERTFVPPLNTTTKD
jgi:Domain of unknown function (DUF4263)